MIHKLFLKSADNDLCIYNYSKDLFNYIQIRLDGIFALLNDGILSQFVSIVNTFRCRLIVHRRCLGEEVWEEDFQISIG